MTGDEPDAKAILPKRGASRKQIPISNLHDNEAFDVMYGAGSKDEMKNLRSSYMKYSATAMKPSTKKEIKAGRMPMTKEEHAKNIAMLDRLGRQKGVPFALEVKAKHNSAKDQFTIRKECRLRKSAYVKKWNREAYCLFIDANGMHDNSGALKSGANPKYYFRPGVGSWNKSTMTEIKKKDLPRLVKTLSAGKEWKG